MHLLKFLHRRGRPLMETDEMNHILAGGYLIFFCRNFHIAEVVYETIVLSHIPRVIICSMYTSEFAYLPIFSLLNGLRLQKRWTQETDFHEYREQPIGLRAAHWTSGIPQVFSLFTIFLMIINSLAGAQCRTGQYQCGVPGVKSSELDAFNSILQDGGSHRIENHPDRFSKSRINRERIFYVREYDPRCPVSSSLSCP